MYCGVVRVDTSPSALPRKDDSGDLSPPLRLKTLKAIDEGRRNFYQREEINTCNRPPMSEFLKLTQLNYH